MQVQKWTPGRKTDDFNLVLQHVHPVFQKN